MKVKVECEKVGLKLNIQKTKIMASRPITSGEIDGETVSDFTFWQVVSSAYLRLLVFCPAILIPAFASFSLELLMIYSAY